MEIFFRSARTVRTVRITWWVAAIAFALVYFVSTPKAFAYDEFTHEWITRSALDYLRTHGHHQHPETNGWIAKIDPPRGFAEESLVRAVVDTDYKTDLWLKAIFHPGFTGATSSGLVNLFTTLFHFLNVTTPGQYWAYDGYGYRYGTKQGNDTYLDYITVTLMGEDSTPLGGTTNPNDIGHGTPLPRYDRGFLGTERDWKELYLKDHLASLAVFPPSNVPAELAYETMLKSPRSAADKTDAWWEGIKLVKGIFTTENLHRNYWRGEPVGLPSSWDLLGMAMHLTQDATVPQHVEDTSDNCHPEYEAEVDELTCGSTTHLDYTAYYNGTYEGPRAGCGLLYDPALVESILNEMPWLGTAAAEGSLTERMIGIAKISAQWKWQTTKHGRTTYLPGGDTFSASACSGIFTNEAVIDRAKYQYNLAIAASASLFETAAHEYEGSHAAEMPAALQTILGSL